VFCNAIGGLLHQSNVDRRCFASLVKRAGVPVEVVSQMLGHSDIATTLRFYRHVRPSELHAAADVMGRLLGG
jgi:site-specific recombinase XerD